jgi:hypothetical protein
MIGLFHLGPKDSASKLNCADSETDFELRGAHLTARPGFMNLPFAVDI